ncbi:MAG: hypothetical protein JRJ24_12655, partial [Deltaproteobacteria bacterium]|nr:hypothetical protein [Deltaproteobacteria bacterium]
GVIRQTEFDSVGNVTRVEIDTDADGLPNSISTSTYATVGWGSVVGSL